MPTRTKQSTAPADVTMVEDIPTNGVKATPTPTVIPRIDVRKMLITLIGDAPLIVHKWSEKAKKQILDKQMKKAKVAKDAKNPQQDYEDSLYVHPEGGYGFPTIGFKNAAVGACRYADGIKMTEARGAFHIVGELAKIEGEPSMREDMVSIGMGVADIRFRGEFKEWRTTLQIRYNTAVLSPEQIVNLFNLAGFGVGVGEWRAERNGNHGLFHVETEEDIGGAREKD